MLTIHQGDCRTVLAELPAQSVQCCVTSPPYFGLRDYGTAGQIGLEATPEAYVAELVAVFRDVRRVLRDDGTLWLNLGDSYSGGKIGRSDYGIDDPTVRLAGNTKRAVHVGYAIQRAVSAGMKSKDLIGIPWRVAFALQADGWYLRQDIIWSKPNPMPESVTDRCTKAHEYIFLMSKSARYYYDADAIAEPFTSGPKTPGGPKPEKAVGPQSRNGHSQWERSRTARPNPNGRNRRSVWEVATQPYTEAHFATFPPNLIEPCILAGCPKGGTVLDPFGGAGTTGMVADRLQRSALLIELNPAYADMAENRLRKDAGMFAEIAT